MTDSVKPSGDSTAASEPFRPAEKPSKPERSWLSWLGYVGGASAFLALAYSLFGLGVIIGLATLFGLHPGMFTGSTFDLLMACWSGVLVGFNGLAQVSLWRLVCSAYTQWWAVMLICSLMVALYAILKASRIASLTEWLTRHKSWLASRPKIQDHTLGAALVLLCLWLWPAVVAMGSWAFMMLSALFVTIIPLLGYNLGRVSALEYVIKPEHCAVSQSRHQAMTRQKSNGAVCIVVTGREADKSILHQGRVVLSTGNYVFLYDAASGIASRVLIGDKIVRSWGAEDREPSPESSLPLPSSAAAPAASAPLAKLPKGH